MLNSICKSSRMSLHGVGGFFSFNQLLIFSYDPVLLSCCSAFLTSPSGQTPMIQTSRPLDWYFRQKSHGRFTAEHRRGCPIYAGGFGGLQRPLEASFIPERMAMVKGRIGMSWGRPAVLQQSKGWHREVREGMMLLKTDFGKTKWEFVPGLGGLEGRAGLRVACSGGVRRVLLCTQTERPDSRELELCLGAAEEKSPSAPEQKRGRRGAQSLLCSVDSGGSWLPHSLAQTRLAAPALSAERQGGPGRRGPARWREMSVPERPRSGWGGVGGSRPPSPPATHQRLPVGTAVGQLESSVCWWESEGEPIPWPGCHLHCPPCPGMAGDSTPRGLLQSPSSTSPRVSTCFCTWNPGIRVKTQ